MNCNETLANVSTLTMRGESIRSPKFYQEQMKNVDSKIALKQLLSAQQFAEANTWEWQHHQ
jgi:hypothetical protein